MSEEVHFEAAAGWAKVTIDRPARRNAVDRQALAVLGECIAAAVADEAVRALVLTGAGGHFCAGADLSTLEDAGFAAALRRVLQGLADAPIPCIAAVEGAALGAGTQLAVACDLRVATPDAVFGIPAGRLGLVVDHWTVQRLALDGGFAMARAMLVGGQRYRGEELHRLGFVQRLGGADDAAGWAAEVAELAPLTLAGHKLGLRRLEQATGSDAEYQRAFRAAWGSADVAEGMAAFTEKRPPRFQGR